MATGPHYLMRWMLRHQQPAILSLDHPVQEDIARAADEIESLQQAGEQIIKAFDRGELVAGDLYAMRAALAAGRGE